MATTMPLSVPNSMTPANAASAQTKPVRRIRRIARNSAGLISPIE
jgi:hypothetical protein